MSGQQWVLLAPLGVALAAALGALAADAFATPRAGSRVAIAGLAASSALFAYTAFSRGVYVGGVVAVGGTWAVIDAALAGLAALMLAAGEARLSRLPHRGQIAALVAFSTAASVVLLGAEDIAVFVLALELVALAGYALVASARTARAYEAAMKYFVQGAIATGLLLYGVAVLFGVSGGALGFTVAGDALAAQGAAPGATIALVLTLSAVAFKVGAFPFHSWVPDAYETAPASVAAFLASVPKVAAIVAATRLLLGPFAVAVPTWVTLAAALALGSVAFGNLAALRQTSFRRMLGYSGVAQVGYALIAVAAAGQAMQFNVVIFSLAYALAAAGAFLGAEAAGDGTSWDGSIAGMAGLGRRRPVLAASLAVCLLSLTGIPLTVGFWGKFFAFASATGPMLWLTVAGVVGSVVSFGYYGAVLRTVYLDETGAPEPAPEPLPEPEAGEVPGLVPRSVGAMAAQDPPAEGGPAWPVALVAAAVLVAGIAPLVGGVPLFYAFLRVIGG